MAQFPRYSYPFLKTISFAGDVLLGHRRSFRMDSIACIERLRPPLRILGRKYIPRSGPCVITFNHYYRPGFRAWWLALGVAAVIPADMHWIMTSEWTFPGRWFAPLGVFVSHQIISRLAKSYGFTTMPPMPPRPEDIQMRAASVRAVLSFVRQSKRPVLGLAPEGGDAGNGHLSQPPSGVGRFALLLSRAGMTMVPVGAYEKDGCFTLKFGPAYRLRTPDGLSADEKDRRASKTLMENIARQLPPLLRGEFGNANDRQGKNLTLN